MANHDTSAMDDRELSTAANDIQQANGNAHDRDNSVPRPVSHGSSTKSHSPADLQRSSSRHLQVGVTKVKNARRLSNRTIRDKLCNLCTKLNLTFNSFVIDDKSAGRGPGFWGKRRMGSFNEIKIRSSECELCQLLVESMERRPKLHRVPRVPDSNAICLLFWTLDGRERVQSTDTEPSHTIKRTRRLKIEWESESMDQTFRPSYIVLVAPDGLFLANKGTFNPTSNLEERSTFFLGRKLTSLDKANIELVKGWLKLCSQYHPECQIDHENPRFRDLLPEPFFSIIDVEKMCLASLPENAKYLALSYTWGTSPGSPMVNDVDSKASDREGNAPDGTAQPLSSSGHPKERFKTTSKNVRDMQKEAGIKRVLKEMPIAIQNAIYLTRHLGFKYIWIDSLCIVQDSADSWLLNARVMDIVYGNAELTICAADGDGADVGLGALYADPDKSIGKSFRPASTQQIIHKYTPQDSQQRSLELMLSWPSETYIECSRWNHRAWTFQERMISPRCLICVNYRVYFQCRTTTMSEDIFSDDIVYTDLDAKTVRGSAGWSVELSGAPAHTLKRLQTDPISVYKDCLRMYTTRELTFEKDTLSAFTGIGNVITHHLGFSKYDTEEDSTLIFGLPASHFDFALLWQPEDVPTRRAFSDNRFPSWSWSGWRCKKGISYRRAAVYGPEINLHEWLLLHTWITYYIRNDKGQLRLVWDPKRYTQNARIEPRWRGYDTPDTGFPTSTGSLDIQYDFHGRPFRTDLPLRGRVHEHGQPAQRQFELLLPPFVSRNRMIPPSGKRGSAEDKPYLQFWTWWGRFYVRVESEEERLVKSAKPAGEGLKRYAILDRHQDFAGVVLLDAAWSDGHDGKDGKDMAEFIAISDAREFDESEYGYWNSYVEEDQTSVPWQLYNVLMIIRDDPNAEHGENVAFRRGLGKIYKQAFENACAELPDEHGEAVKYPIWKEILLG